MIAIVIGAVTGLMTGNGIPHFIRGITKQPYPSVFGSGPVVNLVLGWISLTLAAVGYIWIAAMPDRASALVASALGVLAIGLFHARIGAFGRDPKPKTGS